MGIGRASAPRRIIAHDEAKTGDGDLVPGGEQARRLTRGDRGGRRGFVARDRAARATARAADDKGEITGAGVAPTADALGEGGAGHVPAALIERDEHGAWRERGEQ